MKVDQIREKFLAFFAAKGHPLLPSDSLVPQNDPSLLFTGAGMNQFKDYFLGVKKDLKRAATSQKCLRTGDLENVGKTAFHHSFFEMLGNFSFGDYFKQEAIEWAWEFLTRELKIPKERLRISVHKDDHEAFEIWKNKIGIKEAWIYKMGDKSNFWPANAPAEGPNGPCGPCSEIYFDQQTDPMNPELTPLGIEDPRFTEIWNLVFTQFDRRDGGALKPLAQKNIDTGMGLERLACVLQGKKTNFEIDSLQMICQKIAQLLHAEISTENRMSLYAVTDHLRASVFCIGDGVVPSNEGRGYVARKLIRRALWHAKQIAPKKHLEKPFLYKAVETVAQAMRAAYPELLDASESIASVLRSEEERFLSTLDTGLRILEDRLKQLDSKNGNKVPGAVVFELYDTYGFPEELTRAIAESRRLTLDDAEFKRLMEEQRKRAKDASQITSEIFSTSDLEKQVAKLPATTFLGYQTLQSKGKILYAEIKDRQGVIVLDQTPFYAESGGQVGDQGILKNGSFKARVKDTQKKDKCFLHVLEAVEGEIKTGDEVEAAVDAALRDDIMRNHTATHLLHAALRQLLGKQVRQLGSLVSAEKLRFDYSYSSALNAGQIKALEDLVNREIWKNTVLLKEEKNLDQAKQDGAIAFFGEKYGDKVRVVTVADFSKELCGGTHCQATGQIGFFVITSESSIASGTRRIEAKTGSGAFDYLRQMRDQMNDLSQKLKTTPAEIPARITKLQETIKKLEKEKTKTVTQAANPKAILEQAAKAGQVHLASFCDPSMGIEQLRALSDSLKSASTKTVYLLASEEEEKVHCILGLSPDLKDSALDLRPLWKEIAPLIQASGGGRKDMIQAGGKNSGQLKTAWPEAVNKVVTYLEKS